MDEQVIKSKQPQFMGLDGKKNKDFSDLSTPCYIIDEKRLRQNGEVLLGIQKRTGCKILLAQKAFSNYDFYPILENYLAGTEASGLYEARLGKEEMPDKECHIFCAAYRQKDFDEILKWADHIIFNSPHQLEQYGPRAKKAGKSIGLRINPECSTQDGHEIYDPCAAGSRLGTTRSGWDEAMTTELIGLLDGLHFHTLCEQNADALEMTLKAVEEKFGEFLCNMKWLNMGGGHHITRVDYDVPLLEQCIKRFSKKYNLQIYLEPGEAVALNAGYLVTEVLDVLRNGKTLIGILDMSAACHTPDVLEMPYRPTLLNADEAGKKTFTYRLGGPTCLAGDIVGDYSFDEMLYTGKQLIFGDMAIYSMCKNNTFNGMQLPHIYTLKEDGTFQLLAQFDYFDFKKRLGT